MNKKFSTLMASALLATSVGAFAQISNPGNVTDGIEDGRWYALGLRSTSSLSHYVSVSENDNGVFEFKAVANNDLNSLSKIDSALWRVTPTTTAEGGAGRFILTNKATGVVFAFDEDNAALGNGAAMTPASKLIGGPSTQWEWFESPYAADVALSNNKFLSIDFHNNDSTMVVNWDRSENVLYVTKGLSTSGTMIGTIIDLVDPGTWVMSATDLNTKGDDVKYMELTFANSADVENPFAGKLQAQQLIGNPDTVGSTTGRTIVPFSK